MCEMEARGKRHKSSEMSEPSSSAPDMDMATESSEAALAMASGLQAGAERAKQLLEREDYANAALEASGASRR